MNIRFVLPSEVEQLIRSVVTSLPSKTPAALLQNMEGELHRPDEGRYLGCLNGDGTLPDSILMMDSTLNARGAMMPMGAAACVSINSLRKKERVACTLLKVSMRYYAEQGMLIGCLHPFNLAFYASVGYGYCNKSYPYQPKPFAIRSYDDRSELSYARPEGRQEILGFYRVYTAHTHGTTIHHYMDPHRVPDMPYVVVRHWDNRLTGYFTFDFVVVDRYIDMYYDLLVPEVVYEGLGTLRQFITFSASQVDQVEQVRILSPDLSLTILSHNPGTDGNRIHDDCTHEVTCRTIGYTACIFDMPAYFYMQSRCESSASRPFVLALQVGGSFIEGNNGTFLLDISGDTVGVVEHAQPDATLFVDISTPPFLVIGVFSLNEVLRLGHLTPSGHGYATDVQRTIG